MVLPRTQQGKQLQGELIYVCYFFTMLICMLNKLKPGCIWKKKLLYSAPVAALANLPPSIIENFFCSASAFLKGFSRPHYLHFTPDGFKKNVYMFLKIEITCRKKPFNTVKVEKTFLNNSWQKIWQSFERGRIQEGFFRYITALSDWAYRYS